jgi:hypothetical protein
MAVSTIYPQNYNIEIDEKHVCWPIENSNIYSIISSFLSADCWGLLIYTKDGVMIPLINTYALIEELGYSLGSSRKYCKQHEQEQEYRNFIISNPDNLINSIGHLGTISIYMYGENGYVVMATKYCIPIVDSDKFTEKWFITVRASSEYIRCNGEHAEQLPQLSNEDINNFMTSC